jgi:hypothetical protein
MKLTTNLSVSECLNRLTKPIENVPSDIKTIIDERYGAYFLPEGESKYGTNIYTKVNGSEFEIQTKGWRKVPGGVVPTRRKYARFTGKVSEDESGGAVIEYQFQNSDTLVSYIVLSLGWVLSLVLLLLAPSRMVQTGLLIVAFAAITILLISSDVANRTDILGFIKVLLETDEASTKEETK